MHVILTAVLVCGFLVAPLAAQPAADTYREANNALYNLDFALAQRHYETLTRQYPDNPDYWNALASALSLKILHDQQKLNMESFSGPGLGTRDSRDAVSAVDERRLRDTVATAISKAQAVLDRNPRDVGALYALGAAHGTLAAFEGSVKRSYRAAYTNGKRARELHQQVLALDPNYSDAYVMIGMYDYAAAVIPATVRAAIGILTFGIVRIGGDGKDVGIQRLETAARLGARASIDAKMLLVVVYNREQQYAKSLQLIEELHRAYPRNYLFEMSKASILGRMKDWNGAIRTYQQIMAKVESRADGYERLRSAKVHADTARALIELHRFDDAMARYGVVVAVSDATSNERADAHLWIGKILDSRKERETALVHYRAILALDCDAQYKRDAQNYIRRPFA